MFQSQVRLPKQVIEDIFFYAHHKSQIFGRTQQHAERLDEFENILGRELPSPNL